MSIEEKIKTAKEDSWLKDSVGEKEFKEIKDNERKMTNEEAKQIFLDRGFVNGIFDGNKWRETVIVISKWLKQEHCEDLISRQAVINALKDNSVEMGGRDFCGFGVYYDDIESIVNGVSSIEKNDINNNCSYGHTNNYIDVKIDNKLLKPGEKVAIKLQKSMIIS